ncbi:hypothetical protein SARC_03765 [Sphaeroforma arctica JP610]|uniref:C2H2-type domain-containing protein n=1 Tax=Sphaeroforma arctica JP610 TaxID=667725 RepID=A0A0L0G504_9EUKA|nr:hypothetical protein SARC_03765 [Sphaeroforma arctica JP610]KNC84004.1 hypothetical protein SARC_03765 [Sphaeroforma arctica JP610]|eukprot:XP_014157906.1 hypothetical protein SARC_03765 [Sphaeroforma arctica JP610]
MTLTPDTNMPASCMIPLTDTNGAEKLSNSTSLKSFTLNMPSRPQQQRVLPAGPIGYPLFQPALNSPILDGSKRPRARRTFKQLKREVQCTVEGCTRRYATSSSLQTHMRIKHADILAEMPPKKGDSAKSRKTVPPSPVARDRAPQSPYSRIRPSVSGPSLPSLNPPLRSFSFDCGTGKRTDGVLFSGSGLNINSMEAFDMSQFTGAINTPSLDSFDLPTSPMANYGTTHPMLIAHPVQPQMLSQRATPIPPMHPHPLGMVMSQQSIFASPQPIPRMSMASHSHNFDMRPILRQQSTYTEFSSCRSIHTPTSSITPTPSIVSRSMSMNDSETPDTDLLEGNDIDLASFPGLFGHLEFDSLFSSEQEGGEKGSVSPSSLAA